MGDLRALINDYHHALNYLRTLERQQTQLNADVRAAQEDVRLIMNELQAAS